MNRTDYIIKRNLSKLSVSNLYNLLQMNECYDNKVVCLAFLFNEDMYYNFVESHLGSKKIVIIDNYIEQFEWISKRFSFAKDKIQFVEYDDKIKFNKMPHFDVTIMNPPYIGSTFHLKIIENSLYHSNIVIAIHPAAYLDDYAVIDGWKSSPKKKYAELLGPKLEKYTFFNDEDFGKIFGIASWCNGMIGVYNSNINNEIYKEISKRNSIEVSIINKVAKPIYLKEIANVTSMYNKNNTLPYFIKLTRVHGHVGNKDQYDVIAPDIKYSLNIHDKEHKEVYFKTKKEATNFFNSLNTYFIKFLKGLGCFGSGDFNNGFPFMNDYTEEWTTERFAEYFNLNEEEVNYINNFFYNFYEKFNVDNGTLNS